MSAPSVRKTSYLIKESFLRQLLGCTRYYVAGTLPGLVGSSGGGACYLVLAAASCSAASVGILCSFHSPNHGFYFAVYKCLISHFHLTKMFASELYRDASLGCDHHEDEESRCECWEPSAWGFEATLVAVVGTHVQTGGFLSVYITLLSHLQLKAMKKVKPCGQEGHINVSIERSKLVSGGWGVEVPALPHHPSYAPSRPAPRCHLRRELCLLAFCFTHLGQCLLFLWKIKGNWLPYSFSLLLGFDTWIHVYTRRCWSSLPALLQL